MREKLPFVDVVIGNKDDVTMFLGIEAGTTDVEKGELDIDRYPDVAAGIVRQFEQVPTCRHHSPGKSVCKHPQLGSHAVRSPVQQSVFCTTRYIRSLPALLDHPHS
jgi:hypothetical protein